MNCKGLILQHLVNQKKKKKNDLSWILSCLNIFDIKYVNHISVKLAETRIKVKPFLNISGNR